MLLMLTSHLGYLVMMLPVLPMAGNLKKFQVTNDVISGYPSARSGQAWIEAIMHKVNWQY